MQIIYSPGLPDKYPFWSEIIPPPDSVYITIPATSYVRVSIQPSSGETWLIFLDSALSDATKYNHITFYHYDLWDHTTMEVGGTYGDYHPHLSLTEIISHEKYAQIEFRNYSGSSVQGIYAYSGFKLSERMWSPKRKFTYKKLPFKREPKGVIPSPFNKLKVFLDPEGELTVALEEDTVLAEDSNTGFPVERLSVYCKLEVLRRNLLNFRKHPIETGWKRYFDKWKKEGLKL